jgi:hypothetical protein
MTAATQAANPDAAALARRRKCRVPSERNRRVFVEVVVGGREQPEVAREFGITQQRVSQIIEQFYGWRKGSGVDLGRRRSNPKVLDRNRLPTPPCLPQLKSCAGCRQRALHECHLRPRRPPQPASPRRIAPQARSANLPARTCMRVFSSLVRKRRRQLHGSSERSAIIDLGHALVQAVRRNHDFK